MHIPVLLNESIDAMNLKPGDLVIDCTINRAGHSLEIAKKIGPDGVLICFDLDRLALDEAKTFLNKNLPESVRPKFFFVNNNFREIKVVLENILKDLKFQKIDALIADLGISSEEIEESGRGFTFQKDEPLLMTFSDHINKDSLTARDIVNNWEEKNLADIIYYYGDEKYSRRIAKKICEYRKEKEIKTTFDLVHIIELVVPSFYKRKKIHFATRTFQALRITVNDELSAERELLESLKDILKEKHRAIFLTFHSGEDRVIKRFIKENKNSFTLVKIDNKRDFLVPSRLEIKNNVRARSVKLRVIEKK